MKAFISSVILLAAAVGPAHAQIYKWVDAAGKTHYSDTAPMDGKKPGTVTDRISVYAPAPALLARAAATPGPDPALSNRVDGLERQLHTERLARARQQAELASLTQASQSVYERCLLERRVDCDAYGGTMPYAGPIAVVPVRHLQRRERRDGRERREPGHHARYLQQPERDHRRKLQLPVSVPPEEPRRGEVRARGVILYRARGVIALKEKEM